MIASRLNFFMNRSMKSESGFTLIEIMIVLAIIGLLAAMLAPNFMGVLQGGRVDTAKMEIRTLETSLLNYNIRHGRYPTTDEGLEKLIEEGYIQDKGNALIDPWGNPYHYRYPGQHDPNNPEIWSLGADGQPGGEGNNAEIRSWE